jgi:hypothetical protein
MTLICTSCQLLGSETKSTAIQAPNSLQLLLLCFCFRRITLSLPLSYAPLPLSLSEYIYIYIYIDIYLHKPPSHTWPSPPSTVILLISACRRIARVLWNVTKTTRIGKKRSLRFTIFIYALVKHSAFLGKEGISLANEPKASVVKISGKDRPSLVASQLINKHELTFSRKSSWLTLHADMRGKRKARDT